MGIVVDATFGSAFPVTFHDVVAAQVAVVRKVAVHVVAIQNPIPGFQAARAGNPDGWMGLLHGPRPNADVAQLVVLAVEDSGLVLRPGLHDHVVGLGMALPQGDGHLAVGEGGVHGRADREAGTRRPPDITSNMAISSATRTGGL